MAIDTCVFFVPRDQRDAYPPMTRLQIFVRLIARGGVRGLTGWGDSGGGSRRVIESAARRLGRRSPPDRGRGWQARCSKQGFTLRSAAADDAQRHTPGALLLVACCMATGEGYMGGALFSSPDRRKDGQTVRGPLSSTEEHNGDPLHTVGHLFHPEHLVALRPK